MRARRRIGSQDHVGNIPVLEQEIGLDIGELTIRPMFFDHAILGMRREFFKPSCN
jgi:hypothetical protein